ncbi:flagellin [Brevundimonas sp. 2R-24]|uniref:Flagellin n=1 Tax=Peiella sedimenti TaxID=3061083 RepID=A0ABT8SML9_9CAUL|nr:flagellin [Caulobacteraceae bacterium XZ-24]
MSVRTATFANYQTALSDLMRAQQRGQEAQTRVSTQKVATDLKGFGRASETLTALQSTQARLKGFTETSEAVAARLSTQAVAIDRVKDAAQGARQAIADALASGRVDGLMLDLQSAFLAVQDGLNTKHQGRYLFSGGRTEEPSVSVHTMEELAAAPSVAGVFQNDQLRATSRVDETSTLQTGFLASELGQDLFDIFKALQQFNDGADGPFTGALTDAQRDFLEDQLPLFDAARETVIAAGARNGSLQNRVDAILESHKAQDQLLTGLIGDKTDADMAKAITDLQLSQVAIQASAQVLNQLRQVSLLNLLGQG